MTPPATSALEALRAGDCSPSCLLSRETGRCGCRCQGTHHGELRRAIQAGAEASTPAARKLSRAARRRRKRTEPRTAA
jgi:hypothetical protein